MGVLKAKVGGSWVPITQGFSSAQVGFVAQQVSTAQFATSGTHTNYQDTGMAVTINEPVGHTLKVSMLVNPYAFGGPVVLWYRLLRNGVTIREFTLPVAALDAGASHSITFTHVVTNTVGGSGVVYKTQIRAGTGTNTEVRDYADATINRSLLIEDITQVQPYDQPLVEAATYTPILTAMAVGVGGTNTADYTFVGASGLGGKGILNVVGRIAFGTSGQTFPTSASRMSLPPGFNLTPPFAVTLWHLGQIRGSQNGTWEGMVVNDVANLGVVQMNFAALSTTVSAGAAITTAGPTASFPSVWAAAGEIRWYASLMVVRV